MTSAGSGSWGGDKNLRDPVPDRRHGPIAGTPAKARVSCWMGSRHGHGILPRLYQVQVLKEFDCSLSTDLVAADRALAVGILSIGASRCCSLAQGFA